MLTIRGEYKCDDNFISVFSQGTMYTIPVNDNDHWGSISVGQKAACGIVLSQEKYDQWKAECNDVGTFELPEESDLEYPYDDEDSEFN